MATSLVLSFHEAISRHSLECFVEASLDYAKNCMSEIYHLGVLVHPANLRGQYQDIPLRCTAYFTTILADSTGQVQCQGNGNSGFYSILNGMNLNANKVFWAQHVGSLVCPSPYPSPLPFSPTPPHSTARMGLCSHHDCTRLSRFNIKGITPAAFCEQHAENGMVIVGGRRCCHASCTKKPSFNTEGSKKAAYCKTHADDGMVDVCNRRCSHGICTKRPTFNTAGSKNAAYCIKHAANGMIDVYHRRCSHASCTKQPSFNTEGCKSAAYCRQHAAYGTVDVRNGQCSDDSCIKTPSFNFDGIKPAVYCKQHAADGMVNVCKTNHCLNASCTTAPSFNSGGSKKAAYCKKHALDRMVRVNYTQQCSHIGCTRERVWGVPADCAPTVCFRHKDDIVDGLVFSFRVKCKFEGCGKHSRWGLTGEQPTHCPGHGRLENGLVCTIATIRGKVISPSPSYRATRGTPYNVKTECLF